MCQPSTVGGHEWEQVEIPGVHSSRHTHGDTEMDGTIDEQYEHEQQEEEQEWEKAPLGAVAFLLADSLTLRFRRPQSSFWSLAYSLNVKAQISCKIIIHEPGVMRAESYRQRRVASTGGGSYISIQDIVFLSVEEQRETDRGHEYLLVGKM
jgi:hypothetical protein